MADVDNVNAEAAAAAPAQPEAPQGPGMAEWAAQVGQILLTLGKCSFLAFLLAYDEQGPNTSFFVAAIVLFAVHMIQTGNFIQNIVIVQAPPQTPQPAPAPAAGAAAPVDAAAAPAAGPDGTPAPAAGAAAPAPAPAPPRRRGPMFIVRCVIVFVESLLPSWTLREVERHLD